MGVSRSTIVLSVCCLAKVMHLSGFKAHHFVMFWKIVHWRAPPSGHFREGVYCNG